MDEHSIQYLMAKGALACVVACALAFPVATSALSPRAALAASEAASSASSSSSSASSESSAAAEPSSSAAAEPSKDAPEPSGQSQAGAASGSAASGAASGNAGSGNEASGAAQAASSQASQTTQPEPSNQVASAASSSASSSSSSASSEAVPPLDALQVKLTAVEIEKLTETYEEAQKKVEAAEKRAAEHQKKVDALQSEIDAQQLTSDRAFRDAYILSRDKYATLEIILGTQSLQEFLLEIEYLERINKASIDEFKRLIGMKQELETVSAQLKAATDEAESQAALAKQALRAAQDERAARAKKANATDGADWYMSEQEFVDAWKDRLDKYLAGSPLEGQGANFAKSAFRYCIDPRWSAAISTIESGKGAICIRPHNAWGWGAADSDPYNLASEWATWESAIDAHAKGLSRGYGYTVTRAGARTYCPPNWERWYDVVSSEMAKM